MSIIWKSVLEFLFHEVADVYYSIRGIVITIEIITIFMLEFRTFKRIIYEIMAINDLGRGNWGFGWVLDRIFI